jgi:hypothetical protein
VRRYGRFFVTTVLVVPVGAVAVLRLSADCADCAACGCADCAFVAVPLGGAAVVPVVAGVCVEAMPTPTPTPTPAAVAIAVPAVVGAEMEPADEGGAVVESEAGVG